MYSDAQLQTLANILIGMQAEHINAAIKKAIDEHAILHEPSNRLHFDWDLDELTNVNMTGKADGDVPVWDDTAGEWHPGTGGAGTGGKRQLGYIIAGDLVAGATGPTVPNLLGETITFTHAQATVSAAPTGAAITCSLVVNGTTVNFTIDAGDTASDLQTGLSIAWADATDITGGITTVGSTLPGTNLSMVLSE